MNQVSIINNTRAIGRKLRGYTAYNYQLVEQPWQILSLTLVNKACFCRLEDTPECSLHETHTKLKERDVLLNVSNPDKIN